MTAFADSSGGWWGLRGEEWLRRGLLGGRGGVRVNGKRKQPTMQCIIPTGRHTRLSRGFVPLLRHKYDHVSDDANSLGRGSVVSRHGSLVRSNCTARCGRLLGGVAECSPAVAMRLQRARPRLPRSSCGSPPPVLTSSSATICRVSWLGWFRDMAPLLQHTTSEVDPGATTALSWGMSTSGRP